MYYKVQGLQVKLGTLDPFLKEMGLEKMASQEMLKVNRTDMSEETQIVVLDPKQRNGG